MCDVCIYMCEYMLKTYAGTSMPAYSCLHARKFMQIHVMHMRAAVLYRNLKRQLGKNNILLQNIYEILA